jgi:hypothetical protein
MFHYTLLLDFRDFRMQYIERSSKKNGWFSSNVGSAAL